MGLVERMVCGAGRVSPCSDVTSVTNNDFAQFFPKRTSYLRRPRLRPSGRKCIIQKLHLRGREAPSGGLTILGDPRPPIGLGYRNYTGLRNAPVQGNLREGFLRLRRNQFHYLDALRVR